MNIYVIDMNGQYFDLFNLLYQYKNGST